MSPITTHVLDLSLGRPAAGVAVTLFARVSENQWDELARGITDADGRVRDLLPQGAVLTADTYRLHFAIANYFRTLNMPAFYPEVVITFVTDATSSHYHVPVLLSPFGYSTYRGS